jgi:GT2 family glycosyltransferase
VKPFFTVIVPVYRQWALVPGLLASLERQAFSPTKIEILLVNNSPGDEIPPLVLPPNARLLTCLEPGSYAARNAGSAEARGEWLVFTDADCSPHPGWLAAFAQAAAETSDLLAGPVVAVCEVSAPNPYQIYDRLRGIPQARYVRNGYAATANLAVARSVFEATGGFDPARFSGGDAAFCRKAGRKGYRIRLVEGAVVDHPCRSTWQDLSIKARRVKGGQIRSGPLGFRLQWFLRTLTPPLWATVRFLKAEAPFAQRRMAIGVLFRLWLVEIDETLRLLFGRHPERR